MIKKIINACGCINIKYYVLLFFGLAIIFSIYNQQINNMIKDESFECN